MRVGVDYRILTVGRNLMRRGLGRYSQQQLRAVLDLDDENQYMIVCDAVADTSLVDPAIRAAPNVSIKRLPPSITGPGTEWSARLRRAEAMQSWLAAQGVDLFHATTPFFPAEPFLASFDACPYVATFYDLIPLLYPAHYLAGPIEREVYAAALSLARRADRLIAISHAAAKDAAGYLGVPADRIDVAPPAVDACFGVRPDEEVEAVLSDLRRRAAVPSRFMLSVSFPHHAKNMDALLAAFARLPDGIRLRMPLVVCATLSTAASVVWPQARALGIADDLVFTGPVSEDELTALYNAATLVVHPSRYEGFGLPVVEAMRCGTPVITTTASSLPEVGGDAAILVDPDDVEGMAEAMLRVLEDPGQREEMVRRGLVHSTTFDLATLARRTLASYAAAVERPPAAAAPRLALWSTVPPQPGVVADAVGEALVGPVPGGDVQVFVDDGVFPSLSVMGRHPVVHHSAFERRRRSGGVGPVVYHVGPEPHELFALDRLRRHPGVVVLHQSCPRPWLSHPALDDLADACLALVAADSDLVGALSERFPRTPVRLVPLGVADPLHREPAPDPAAARTRLGWAPGTFVVGVVSHGDDPAPVESTLRAVARFPSPVALATLGPGPDAATEHRLRSLADALGLGPAPHLAPAPGPAERADRLAAADVVVSVGNRPCDACRRETLRAMAARRPVVAGGTALPPVPSGDGWLVVSPDGRHEAHLAAHLRALAADPGARSRLADAGRAVVDDRAGLSRAAAALAAVLAEVAVAAAPPAQVAVAGAPPAQVGPPGSDTAWDALVQALSG
ncbi:MAG: glycosyltransferase [Acidimicrobiales bacterium]